MTHPLTPREKVADRGPAGAVMDALWPILGGDQMDAETWTEISVAVGTALASGSGDHAELAKRLRSSKRERHGIYGRVLVNPDGPEAADTIEALLAENAALRAANTEAERKLAEAVEAMEEIAAIEPKPFEGGLDMEAIRACEECRRYEGHPVQHGICNTHRRPIWDREKHEGHEEKALGYRAKSIARTFLSKEAERG